MVRGGSKGRVKRTVVRTASSSEGLYWLIGSIATLSTIIVSFIYIRYNLAPNNRRNIVD